MIAFSSVVVYFLFSHQFKPPIPVRRSLTKELKCAEGKSQNFFLFFVFLLFQVTCFYI